MKNYVVNCYTCEHNGQETCKGCNTLLNGEDEPYENWELREDLNEKDQQISDLEAKLAEKDTKLHEYIRCALEDYNDNQKEILELKKQLTRSRTANDDLKNKLNKTREELEIANNQILFDNTEFEKLNKQLAEKDEQIKELNKIILISQLQAPEEQRLKIIGSSCCQYNPNQDKISFCIEKLETVKKSIEDGWKMVGYEGLDFNEVTGTIDNQIEELKKEMK